MDRSSTRGKIRSAVKSAQTYSERVFYHCSRAVELADKKHPVINAHMTTAMGGLIILIEELNKMFPQL